MRIHLPLTLLAIATGLAAADPPELAKLGTDDAGTVDPATWEASVGLAHAWTTRAWDADGVSADRGGRATETGLGVSLKYGVVESVDVGVEAGWLRATDDAAGAADEPDSGSGLSDLDLGIKWRCFQGEDDRLAAALVAGVVAPMGRGADEDRINVASEAWAVRAGAVLTGWVDRLAWSTALGVVRPLGSGADESRYEIAWDAAAGWQVADWLQPEIELHHVRTDVVDGDDASIWSLTAGALVPLEIGRFAVGWTRDVAGRSGDQADVIEASFTTAF